MSLAPSLIATLGGLLLIGVALRDTFDVLFHLEGRGDLSQRIMRAVWRAFRRVASRRPRVFPIAGPFGVLAVIGTWSLLVTAGWALVLWPHLESFRDADGDPAQGGFLEALHISLVTLSTQGYADVAPIDQWLRVVGPIEAVIGFGLLTASVAWFLSVHPAVLRRRALAYELWLLRQARDAEEESAPVDERLLAELTSRVVAIERDLVAMPASYYFAEVDDRFSLAAELPYLRSLARESAKAGESAAVRRGARMLDAAIDDLLRTIGKRFQPEKPADAEAALAAFARDHRKREPAR